MQSTHTLSVSKVGTTVAVSNVCLVQHALQGVQILNVCTRPCKCLIPRPIHTALESATAMASRSFGSAILRTFLKTLLFPELTTQPVHYAPSEKSNRHTGPMRLSGCLLRLGPFIPLLNAFLRDLQFIFKFTCPFFALGRNPSGIPKKFQVRIQRKGAFFQGVALCPVQLAFRRKSKQGGNYSARSEIADQIAWFCTHRINNRPVCEFSDLLNRACNLIRLKNRNKSCQNDYIIFSL